MLELGSSTLASLSPWFLLAADEPPASGGLGMKLLFIVGLLVLGTALGVGISRALKMKEISGRLSGILIAGLIGLSPFVWRYLNPPPNAPKPYTMVQAFLDSVPLGIDLAGGTNMVFQVYTDDPVNKPLSNEVMDQMISAVIRRVNPSGTEEVTVRKVGADRIEVIIPGADSELVKAKKTLIARLGSLEFGILANQIDHQDTILAANSLPKDQDLYRVGSQIKAAWRDPGTMKDAEDPKKTVFKQIGTADGVATREVTRNGKTYNQFLVMVEPVERRITGENLSAVSASRDENGGPAVSFRLDAAGARNMRKLSTDNLPGKDGFKRRLAILLDETVHQAPVINEALSSSIQISGMRDSKEVRELVSVLNSGALKVPIQPDPISEFSISPLLGEDVRNKGLFSIELAAIIVVVFMLVYYLRAGVIADLCLLLNLILVLGSMAIFQATFTLPGLAGLVLTIGMAVDANVLIFERMREEKERGASQRMSIQNGFSKALSTIVDANVTTLITAVILYVIGSDAVKGFAVALFIGIVMSMFSVLVFGRLLFDMGEKLKMLGQLKMLDVKTFVLGGKSDWNFLGVRKVAMVLSALLIVGGLSVFFVRGEDNYDIDFTGGSMVTFELDKEASIEEVRKILETKFDNITLERLTIEGDTGDVGKRYRMRTKLRDAEPEPGVESQPTIQHLVGLAFEGKEIQPRRVTVEFGTPVKIELTDAEKPADEPKPEDDKSTTKPTIPYQGGNKVELTFSEEVKPTTAELYFGNALQEFELDGRPKYELKGEDVFGLKGTAGKGMDADATAGNKSFSKMELSVSSTVSPEDLLTALKSMQAHMAENPTFDEVNSFDSSIAGEMRKDAVLAILASLVAIVFYIWIRFDKVTFGLAAVAALIHDVLVVLGLVAICSYFSNTPVADFLLLNDFKINLPMIAAFLTIVGYSLNDTIVVFDRIREVRGKNPAMTISMVNMSLNQTLSRTILTSLTTLLVVVILYIAGGEGIHGFAFCLVMGVIVGTYSSIYVASPVLLWLINRPGSEIGLATARAIEEEAKRAEKQSAAMGA